jgi:protocatechuate 3,4-dioxygenase beta subunit
MSPTTRRGFLAGTLGGVGAVALLHGCSDDAGGAIADSGGTPGADGGAQCTVYPQETEGPYYLDPSAVRRDVTEGKPGAATQLVVTVLGANGCAPLAGVAVDIWHCDAVGVYSGYPGQLGGLDTTGMTFLRGTQVTGADGKASFDTIYPGWYPARSTHIHFKVHLSASSEATSQMYFPEAVTAAVYASGAYAARGPKDTTNAADSAAGGNLPPLLAITGDAATGFIATLTVTVAG